ncbi:hypothetical protein RSSM_01015 [Rhodopirellula sallentina SM41]|uniref:Uncharacterized protein n=1 Tax=Rhodopirellula sallentina SM41 TaxID=1263870 RepID=M5UNG0_9BACT|nr:hypothetical protein RSSM_01015 [Rhodopirellula sallentina SM41]
MFGWWGALFLKRVWFLKRVCESSDLCCFRFRGDARIAANGELVGP